MNYGSLIKDDQSPTVTVRGSLVTINAQIELEIFQEQHFTRESGPEMAKKWQSRFIHSEKRIKKHFQRFLCDWENIEPPHGKKALNTQAKRDLAIGGYDKVRFHG